MAAWLRRLRLRRIERVIAREKALQHCCLEKAALHQVRAAAWTRVLAEIRRG